jgi:uncharacterized protein YjbI with pentapeptide repeats
MRTYTDRDLRMLVARSSVSSPPGHRVPLDLASANLEMATLPHVDFRGANLKGANLRGAMLWGAILDDACLDDADLTCANLAYSDLCGCSMKGTLLVEANLDEALIEWEACLDAVTAGVSTLTINPCAKLTRRIVEEMKRTEETRLARDAAVWRAHLQNAPPSLRKRRTLDQAGTRVLSDDDLEDLLRWSVSTGKPLNLRGCNLSGADLRNASLRGACLAFTNATGADIDGVDLAGADLKGSYGWERP